MATFIFLWERETGFMYLKSPVMQFPSVRLSLLFLRAEYKICTNANKYNWRLLAHLCWKEHIPIYIRDSQLNRLESVSLASLARQLWYVQILFL